jgi:hypothetical protein
LLIPAAYRILFISSGDLKVLSGLSTAVKGIFLLEGIDP